MFVSTPFLDDGHKKALFDQVLAVNNPIVKTVEMRTIQSHSTLLCRLTKGGLQ